MGGIALATAVTGVLWWLRGMGMGDLKLCASVGARIGPGQLGIALVATGMAGGVLALIWAACRGSLAASKLGFRSPVRADYALRSGDRYRDSLFFFCSIPARPAKVIS